MNLQSLDELLTEKVYRSLVDKLSSQYLGQIVQILINLEHFEKAVELGSTGAMPVIGGG